MTEFDRFAAATTALAARYAGKHHGFPANTAFRLAVEVLDRAATFGYQADVIAIALGEAEGCENCPRAAVTNYRCAKCQHLPSDDA